MSNRKPSLLATASLPCVVQGTHETTTERGLDRFELTTSEALRLAQMLTRAVDIADGHPKLGGAS